MARTRGTLSRDTLSRDTTSQRRRPRRQPHVRHEPTVDADQPLDDTEIRVSSTASNGRTAAKRSQLQAPSHATASNPPAAKKARVRVASRSKKWEPANITQSSRSPLVDTDLRVGFALLSLDCLNTWFADPHLQTLLLQPAAWDCLTAEDKAEILALFPDQKHILDAGTPNARPNLDSLKNDDNFRHDAEQYVTNLAKGMHDPIWLRDAWTAHHRRAAGDFDAFYIRKLEVDWNVTIPDEFKPPHLRTNEHGESSSAGHSPKVEGASGAESGNAAADTAENGGAIANGAVESDGVTKTDAITVQNSNGASGPPEDVEQTGKESITIENGVQQGVPNGENSLRGCEKPSGVNGSEVLVADGEASVAADAMDVDGPEMPTHSG